MGQKIFYILALLVCLGLCFAQADENDYVSDEERAYNRQAWAKFFGRITGAHPNAYEQGDGGGVICLGCTVILGLVEQYAQIHVKSIEGTLDQLCSFLPAKFKLSCELAIKIYAPTIIKGFENHETADLVCQDLGVCTNKTCHLFPLPTKIDSENIVRDDLPEEVRNAYIKFPFPDGDGGVADHLPEVDVDHDYFGADETLRGGSWRGRDCDDANDNIYPGRKKVDFPPYVDHDCNGIYGTDPLTGKTYEETFCANTPHYGVAIAGDSAGAHFHIPPTYMTASEIDNTTYMALVEILENEFDWPQMSTTTGHTVTNWLGTPGPPVASMYMYGRERNQCTHRDFQNICVNGARSSAMADGIIQTLKRNQTTDYPLILSFALIGNDVCNGHYGTGSMTTPQEFYNNVMRSLNYLETILPKGSYVVFFGLVDGRILWDSMHNRIHPIGSTDNNVNYAAVYEYMICLEVSPCWGWLNPDAYWRNATSERAAELNQVYKDIVANTTFENFEMLYFPTPLDNVIGNWAALGGEVWQLIEPIDGFHPDQTAMAMLAQYQFDLYLKNYTFLAPPINPMNEYITKVFMDQGSY